MNFKKIKIHVLLFFIGSILLTSCSNNSEPENIFGKTATERLEGRAKELNDLLLSSDQGWKSVYYPDSKLLGGYTFVFKFKNDGTVDMASDFDEDTATHTSQYEIKGAATTALVFTTGSKIGLMSNSGNSPLSDIKGYHGSNEFLYYGKDEKTNEIIFKANKGNGEEVRFVKATGADWNAFTANKVMIDKMLEFIMPSLEIQTAVGTTNYDVNSILTTRFFNYDYTANNVTIKNNCGLSYTPTGVILKPIITVGGQEFSSLTYNPSLASFTATSGNVTVSIKDNYKISNILTGEMFEIFYINELINAPGLSNSFKNAFATAGLTAIDIFFDDPNYGSYISYRKAGIWYYCPFQYEINPNDKGITITSYSYAWGMPPAAVKTFNELLLANATNIQLFKRPYKVIYSNTIYGFINNNNGISFDTWKL